jgi:molecular chaperone GrpE
MEDTQDQAGSGVSAESAGENSAAKADQEQKKAFDELKASYDALNDRLLRLAAEFDNYQKRSARDTENRVKFANERFSVEILEIADNIGRALDADDAHLRQGLESIGQILGRVLAKHGISPIESLGKKFNPAEHEAVAYVPADADEGTIIDEIARGYRMHEKIIRHAKVAVSQGKPVRNNGE